MIELRARPRCYDCETPVSSHADGCDCGVAVLCADCRDEHERRHQQQPREEPDEVYALPPAVDLELLREMLRIVARSNAAHPGYPSAGWTQGWRW